MDLFTAREVALDVWKSLAKSTLLNYMSSVKKWIEFCHNRGYALVNPSTHQMLNFVMWLKRKSNGNVINQHIAGI